MANKVECIFQPGDVIRHKRNRHKGIVYRYVNRYKNTGWIIQLDLKNEINKHSQRKIKINTLNFNYEIDNTYKVLYGTTKV